MQWITAIAAFAVTMFTLSVIVSVMVETVHRFLRSRRNGLRQLIEKLYVHSIEPRLEPAGGGTMTPDQFALLMMENPTAGTAEAGTPVVVGEMSRLNAIDSMPVEVFMQRLGDLKMQLREPSAALNQVAAVPPLEDVVADIAAKFVTFGQEQSVAFERRSRTLAVICALALALVAYVHPLDLARVYLKNPELAEKVADSGEDIEARLTKLDETIARLKTDVPAGQPTLEGVANEISAAVEDIKTEIDTLKAVGVPLGWPGGALVCGDNILVENCLYPAGFVEIPIPSGVNLLWLIFGGLLVGLGAPFWQQIITSLAATNTITQKVASIVGGTEAARTGPLAAMAAARPAEPAQSTALRTFMVADSAGAIQKREPRPTQP